MNLMKTSLLLFCLLVCFGAKRIKCNPVPVSSMDSNAQLLVTQKGLDYANEMFKTSMVSEIEGLKTANVKKSALWTTLELIDPTVKKVALQSSSIRFDTGLVKVHALFKAVEVAGRYIFSGFFSSSRGNFKSTMSQVKIEVDIALGRTIDGKILIKSRGCKTAIPADTMNNQFRGGSSFLLNLGVSLLKNYVKSNVENKICIAVVDAIKTRSATYSDMYTKAFRLTQVPCVRLKYIVAKTPEIKHKYIDVGMKGKFMSSCIPALSTMTANISRAPPVVPRQDKMMTFSLSDQFINSLLNVYHQQELFIISIDVVKAKLQANVLIKPTSQPIISTCHNGSVISLNATVHVNKTTTSGTLLLKDDFEIKGDLVFKVDLVGPRKHLSAHLNNLKAVARSGNSVVQKFVDVICESKVNQALNDTLGHMIPTPRLEKIAFVNPQIIYAQAQVILATDVNMY